MAYAPGRRAVLGAGLALPALARAQGFPDRPLRLILPFAAGGIADVIARPMAEVIRERLGQPLVIDPRPASAGIVAAEMVARAPKDGFTIGYMAYGSLVTLPALGLPLPFRLEEFQPLTPIFRAPQALAVDPRLPVRSVAELVAAARRQPVAYGTSGRGSLGHILMEMLAGQTGARFDNVVYRTDAAVPTDMIAGNIPCFMGTPYSVLEHHRAGQVRILAITAPERLPAFPEIPTFAELGMPFMTLRFFHGLALPAGVPAPVTRTLHAAFAEAILSAPVRARMTPDMAPEVLEPEAFTAAIRREVALLAGIVRERGISVT